MFDIAFSELVVIGLVALIVIGPERLPRVARTAGHLLGRLQRYVGDVKADINREMQIEELKKVQDDIVAQTRGIEQSVNDQLRTVETELNQSIAGGLEDKSAVEPTPMGEPAGAAQAALFPETPAAAADASTPKPQA